MKIQFIDLKAQYRELKVSIDSRIQVVLDHGQYIMGPEVSELEGRLSAYAGTKYCISVGIRHRGTVDRFDGSGCPARG